MARETLSHGRELGLAIALRAHGQALQSLPACHHRVRFRLLIILTLYLRVHNCVYFFFHSSRCMVLDNSYLSCFQLEGPQRIINVCLSKLTLPFTVSTINSDRYPVPPSGCHGFRETINLFCSSPLSKKEEETRASGRLPNITRSVLGPLRILWGPNRQVSVLQFNSLHSTMNRIMTETGH